MAYSKLIIIFFLTALGIGSSNSAQSQIGINGEPVALRENESGVKVEVRDSLLNYFAKASNKYYSYGGEDRAFIHRDSLYPYIKEVITTLLPKYPKNIKLLIDTTTSNQVIPVLTELYKLEFVEASLRNENEIKRIRAQIDELKFTKEKILLEAHYNYLSLKQTVNFESEYIFCKKIFDDILKLEDDSEKGKAFLLIGDFFADKGMIQFAPNSYYTAQVFIYSSRIDSLQKYYLQGVVCERIAALFPGPNTGIFNGIKKQANYFITASDFYEKGKEKLLADKLFLKYLLNYSLLNKAEEFSANEKPLTEANILFYIKNRYIKDYEITDEFGQNEFLVFLIIGNILYAEQKYEEAKSYYLRAMIQCIEFFDIDNLMDCIENVSRVYAKLGNSTLALQYANISTQISSKAGSLLSLAMADINKAVLNYMLNRYDSSLNCIERAFNDFRIKQFSFKTQSPVLDLLIQGNSLKVKIYKETKKDSLSALLEVYYNLRNFQTNQYVNLLLTIGEKETHWLNDVRSWEIATQIHEKNQVKSLNKIISLRNRWLWVSSIILFALIAVVLYLYRKTRKQSNFLKTNLNQKVAFKNITTHDIKKLVNGIPRVLNRRIEKLENISPLIKQDIAHIKNVAGYVNKIFDMNTEPISTIEEQIELSELYAKTFKQTSLPDNYEVKIVTKIDDPFILKNLPVPTLLLNNFIKNSIEHGTSDSFKRSIIIVVKSFQLKNGTRIIVDDNGIGINQAKKSGGTTGRGLEYAIESINVYNTSKNSYFIKFDSQSIYDKEDRGLGRGTIVEIDFIKRKK